MLGQQHPPDVAERGWLSEKHEWAALLGRAFCPVGTMCGFHGRLILGQQWPHMGKAEWSSVPRVPRGSWWLHHGSGWWGGGRVYFSRDQRVNSTILGRIEQPKGCEKIKDAILVTRPFYFEKALLSALNEPLELRGAVPVSPHLLETGLVDFLFLSDVSHTLEPVQRLVQ